jgi:hypothetical protein
LYFEGVLGAVGHWVIAQDRTFVLESGGQWFVYRSIAEWGSPGSTGNYGDGFAGWAVTYAQNHNFLGENDVRKNGSGYMAGESISGMGHEASLHMSRIFVGLWFRVFTDLRD